MRGRRDGFALLGVLAFSLVLLPIVGGFSEGARLSARASLEDLSDFKLAFEADGLSRLVALRFSQGWTADGTISPGKDLSCVEDGAPYTFTIYPLDGKISLNTADEKLLAAGFRAAGLNAATSASMAQFVALSRQSGDVSAHLPEFADVSFKHAPFERVEELSDALASLVPDPVEFWPIFTTDRTDTTLVTMHAFPALRSVIEADPALSQFTAKAEDAGSPFDILVSVGAPSGETGRLRLLQTFGRAGSGVELLSSRLLSPKPGPPSDGSSAAMPSCEALLELGGEDNGS